MAQLTLQELESHLWKSADILRGSVDSADYKNYIFGLLFLKRLSDVFEEHREEIIAEHGEEIGALLVEDQDQYQFFVPEAARWSVIRTKAENIGSAINVAFEALENENATLEGVLTPAVSILRNHSISNSVKTLDNQGFFILPISLSFIGFQ